MKMATHGNESANRFLTKDEEQRFGENLRKALIYQNPNPGREGCPDPKIIRDLAFHKRIGKAQLFEQVTDHMSKCSACVRDALSYAEEYKEQKTRRQRTRLMLAAAAAVVIAVALWAVMRLQIKPATVVESPEAPIQAPVNPVAPGTGARENKPPEIARLETVVLVLPTRWRGAADTEHKLTIPRRPMQLELRLPIGSPEGEYQLRLIDESGNVQKTGEGIARIVNGITGLKFTLDTSNLFPGDFVLSILEPGMDEWNDYRVDLN